jgi:formimidoylglutamase
VNARDWLAGGAAGRADVVLIGAPISKASISPSQAWSTPPAVREMCARFPLWDAEHAVDLSELQVHDMGDIAGDRDDVDAAAAHGRIEEAVAGAARSGAVVIVIGGDNSLTRPAMRAMQRSRHAEWGLLTLDAHHDCRPADSGSRNGTPVRELIEGGLPGTRVAQVGIHPFGNEHAHAAWAAQHGVHVYPMPEIRRSRVDTVLATAVAALVRDGAEALYVDFDVDVVERANAPACPASLPGGMSPDDLLQAAFLLGANNRVRAADITEVDAMADVNGITVRLAAATLLSFCAGVASRSKAR